MPILAINKNLPAFHKVSLYVGESELIAGSISQVALSEDTEVQKVASVHIEKHVQASEAHEELIERVLSKT